RRIKTEDMEHDNSVPHSESVPCNSVPRINAGVPFKEEPIVVEECNCAECRGEVAIKDEHLDTDHDEMQVEVTNDNVQSQDQVPNESEAKSEDDRASISSVARGKPVHAVASNLDGESSGNKKSKYDFPKLNSNQVLC